MSVIPLTHESKTHSNAIAQVSLVGCGTGDPELLTIKAYKAIQQADVVLYDHLLTPEILALIPKGVLCIDVGKMKGHHKASQEEINSLLFEMVMQKRSVVRLKCGDPYVFGRGGEEEAYLQERGVKVNVIPGISSALAAPASAGIPVTSRGYAMGFSVVSAHLRGSRINLSWLDMLVKKKHTTVVLMGLSFAREIQEAALSAGIDPDLKVAVVSNGTRKNQTCHAGALRNLSELAQKGVSPAVLVFGDVVSMVRNPAFLGSES